MPKVTIEFDLCFDEDEDRPVTLEHLKDVMQQLKVDFNIKDEYYFDRMLMENVMLFSVCHRWAALITSDAGVCYDLDNFKVMIT